MEKFEYLDHTFDVGSCDMDMWGFMKPTVILNICQEAAYMHSTLLGFGYNTLVAMNLAWVLSRAKVEIERLPVWGERIRVRTWHKRESGLFGLRDYIFFDEELQPIIRATTSWLIINLATRRITRVDRVFGADKPLSVVACPHDAIEQEAPRLSMPEGAHSLEEHRVVYSDVDVNHHVNNAKYLEWACDNSAQQIGKERQLSSFCLNFNHEARFGESISLSGIDADLDTLLLSGDVSARNIFVAELNYKDRI